MKMEEHSFRSRSLCIGIVALAFIAVAVGSFFIGASTKLGSNPKPQEEIGQNPVEFKEEITKAQEEPQEEESSAELVETFHIEKTPMTHNGTLGITWTTERVRGARTLDYLTPQIPEIFEIVGIETTNEYLVEDSVAKYTPSRSMLRCYGILDRGTGEGIAVLCYTKTDQELLHFSIQVVDPAVIISGGGGVTDFGFADFDGDGKDEIFVTNLINGADHFRVTLGIFPFDSGVWGEPLFWTNRGDTQRSTFFNRWLPPFGFGFELEVEGETYTLHNTNTSYSRILPREDFFFPWSGTEIVGAYISSVTIIDIDADGVYELIIEQDPFQWPGHFQSILKYNMEAESFEILYAETILSGDPKDEEYQLFLQRAGYDAEKASIMVSLPFYRIF